MVSDTKPVSECQLVICHCNMKKSQRVSHLSPVVGRPCLLQLRHPQNPMVRGAGGGDDGPAERAWRWVATLRRCCCPFDRQAQTPTSPIRPPNFTSFSHRKPIS